MIKHHEEKEKEFSNLESEYDQAKHKIQKMMILLKESKNKITSLESQITTLKTENSAFQNRISLSQGDLTPRPTFEKVLIISICVFKINIFSSKAFWKCLKIFSKTNQRKITWKIYLMNGKNLLMFIFLNKLWWQILQQ